MTTDVFTILIIFIFGSAIGSFLNVVAYRSVHGGKILDDRSRCPHCKRQLEAVDLVPLLSFVILKGKCRHCGKKISWHYPVVELSTAVLFIIAYLVAPVFSPTFSLISLALYLYVIFVISTLIIVFITDIKDGIIPDKIVLPAIVIALMFKLVLAYLFSQEIIHVAGTYLVNLNGIALDLAAGLVAGAIFYLIVVFSKGKGMGGGDIKYAAFLGFALGFSSVAVALFIAFLTGAGVALILISVGKKRFGQTVPFGPFLSFGALIALLWGQQIIDWYLNINR